MTPSDENNIPKSFLKDGNFASLKTSISMAVIKQQTLEPQYYALDSLSEESARLSKCSEYASDIERIIKELALTISLVVNLPAEEFFSLHNTNREDYIMYHQGHYLDLVHQLKDKIGQLLDGLTSSSPFKEREKINLSKIAELDKIKEVKGLPELLNIWGQESEQEGGIAVVLRRRTNYHHFRNRLHLNNDFLDIKIARIFSSSEGHLTEYGKSMIEERGNKGFENWYEKVKGQMTNTFTLIQENIESISGVVLGHIKLPNIKEEGVAIYEQHAKMLDSLEIKNIADDGYKKTPFRIIIKTFEEIIPIILDKGLVTLYLTGSTTRGDATYGLSDANFVLVVEDTVDELVRDALEQIIENVAEKVNEKVDIIILTKHDFLSDENKKIRFICDTDGLVLAGSEFRKKEKFPKPSLELSYLLNGDFKNEMKKIKEFIKNNQNLSQEELNKILREVGTRSLHLMFGAVMADTAMYEKSKKKMHDLIIEKYPQNKVLTDIIYGMAKGDTIMEMKDFLIFLETASDEGVFTHLIDQLEEKNKKIISSRKIKD